MRIGVLAASSVANPDAIAPVSAFAAIAYPEVDLVFHPQCYAQDGHFAGSDAVRAAAFLDYANDPAIDAIWFLRGGYGSNRILADVIPRLNDAARAKTYVGYSDVGFVLGALYAQRIGHPAHGPMASDVRRERGDETVARSLGWIARRERAGLEPTLADGRPAAAFNLSILHSLIGTPWMPDLTGHVLMIEEVSEPMYAIDRMLFHMANTVALRSVAGVRLGAVTAVQPNEPGWNEPLDQMITRWCRALGVPYLGRADIGHTQGNHVVPFGRL
jgi:muramoyltetrapeptide carboxypeptidase